MSTQLPENAGSPDVVRFHPGTGAEIVDLVADPRRFTVELSSRRTPLGAAADERLRTRSAPVGQIAHYGLQIFDGTDRARRDDSVITLNADPAVALASPVLHRHTAHGDEVYVTRQVLVQFLPEVTATEVNRILTELSAEIVRPLDYAENGYLLLAPALPGGLGAFTLAEQLRATGRVHFAHPDLISARHQRTTAVVQADRDERDGDLVAQQWHLATAKVTDAWAITRGSRAITVAILDDGVDLSHPEFAGKIVAQHDFTEHSDDASPKDDIDKHGTACAGVAVAAGVHASGAAPDCSLMAIRFPGALGDSDEAEMFRWAADQGADVISCSWGPKDGTGKVDPLPGATQQAIQYARSTGRNGKGIAVCWAAGNGNESVDNDGYASNPHVLAIAALNSNGGRSYYSDMGQALWVTAPSSGNRNAGEKAITTTDRQGAAGYNDSSQGIDADYTNTFGGTSSATPLVAGIVGLMLSANPDLTATQVMQILRDTATKVGTGYDGNGHSTDFGYGLVNALEAVRQAQAAGHPANPNPGQASIVGPVSADRTGGAPSFTLDPGGHGQFYAVEVASRAELLDGGDHTLADGFYGSWQDSSFQSSSPYTLPDAAWSALRSGDRLYYRAWFSTSADSWTDTVVTTENADAANAPSVELTGGASEPDPGTGRAPSITGPVDLDRSGPAPTFEVDPGDGSSTFYAVEVATDPELFDDGSHALTDGFYGSWQDSSFLSGSSYALPDAAWQQLGASASRLYYRAWFSSSAEAWTDTKVTTASADRASAPSMVING